MSKLDVFFKLGVLLIATFFLSLFYISIDNQRYSFHEMATGMNGILDSRTGMLFMVGMPFEGKNYLMKMQLNGEMEAIEIKPIKNLIRDTGKLDKSSDEMQKK